MSDAGDAARPTGPPSVGAALDFVGLMLRYLSLAFAVPIALAVAYGESVWPFVIGGGATFGAGLLLHLTTPDASRMAPRDAFLAVTLGWTLAAVAVSVPYLVYGIPFIDAAFEGMSGVTTTGATVLFAEVEELSRSLLLWRQMTQWLGGLGIVALAMLVLPHIRVAGREVFAQETGGPIELERPKLDPSSIGARITALYVALTAAVALALAALGWTGLDGTMTVYDAVGHAFTTVATGGFSTRAESVGAFAPVTQWVVAAALVIASTNFAVLYATAVRRPLLEGRPRSVWRDEEARFLVVALTVAAVVVIAALAVEGSLGESAARHAVFTVVSIGTSTGYVNTDYGEWPATGVLIVFGLMFLGGSALTACGSIKAVRHLLFLRAVRRELRRSVVGQAPPLRFNHRPVSETVLRGALAFAFGFVVVLLAGAAAIAAFEMPGVTPAGATDALFAATATLSTVGPGIGVTGPGGAGYGVFSDPSKLVMIALMLVGRLEILAVAVLFTRSFWRPPSEP